MSLLKSAANGMAWTTVSIVARKVVQLLQVAILTRFLAKADFGVVAIANLFLGFTSIFLDLGISAGIIHRQDTTPKQYSSLFWLNIIMGIMLAAILCAVSPLIAKAYHEPQLIKIISLLSFTVFFSSLGSQHRTMQQKNMRFKLMAMIEILSAVLTLALAAILAISGFGIYSLVYSSLFHTASASLTFLILGLVKDKNISFHFNLKETYPYLKIGVFSVGAQILDYFSRELDILIISATLGKEGVGLYSLCKQVVAAVYGAINPIITKVLTPLLATLQKEKEHIQTLYYDIVQSLALLNFPIYSLIAIFAVGILNFVFGHDYVEGAWPLTFMALTYGLNTAGNPVGSLQVAMGRTDAGFYWAIFRIVFTAVFVYVGAQFSLSILAFSILLMTIVINPIFWRVTIHSIIGGKYLPYFNNTLGLMFFVILFSIPFFVICHKFTSVPLCLAIGVVYVIFFIVVFGRLYQQSYLVSTIRERIWPTIKSRFKK